MNFHFFTTLLIALSFLVSCEVGGLGEDGVVAIPIDKRSVIEPPITSDDVIDLKAIYVGLNYKQAVSVASKRKHVFRVVSIDGVGQGVTADYVEGRINASLKSGRIASISVEG